LENQGRRLDLTNSLIYEKKEHLLCGGPIFTQSGPGSATNNALTIFWKQTRISIEAKNVLKGMRMETALRELLNEEYGTGTPSHLSELFFPPGGRSQLCKWAL